jgi:hypothetical protein
MWPALAAANESAGSSNHLMISRPDLVRSTTGRGLKLG